LRSVRAKICGLTREEDLAVAIDTGADAVGFLVGVPSSPRNLTLERVETLLGQVPVFVGSVVVTAPKSIDQLVKLCERLKPSAIQIHGKEQLDSSKIRERIKYSQLIKTVYVTEDALNERVIEDLKTFDAVLLDSVSKGQYGGTGKIHDWTLSRQIKEAVAPVPVVLAGGLKPENVKKAVLAVEPYAVDVASGVETSPGVKDHMKVRAFVENAKQVRLHN
jgi:phosphoribosylanthranilate isomerase